MGRYWGLFSLLLLAMTTVIAVTPATIAEEISLLRAVERWRSASAFLQQVGKPAVPPLLKTLEDPHPAVRIRAYRTLEHIPGALTNDQYVQLLSDPALCEEVVDKIDKHWVPTPQQLRGVLNVYDYHVQSNLIRVFLQQTVFPPNIFADCLHDPLPRIRVSCLHILRFALGRSPVITPDWLNCINGIFKAINDTDEGVRLEARGIIEDQADRGMGGVPLITPLIPLLFSDGRYLREGTVRVIADSSDPHRVTVLLDAYTHGNADVRESILMAGMAHFADPLVTALFTEALHDTSPEIARAAVLGLSDSKAKIHLPSDMLLSLLQSEDNQLKDATAFLLVYTYHDRRTIPWLIARLTANDAQSDRTVDYLIQFGDVAAPMLLTVLKESTVPQTRLRAIKALRPDIKEGHQSAIRPKMSDAVLACYRTAVHDADAQVRYTAVDQLRADGDQRIIDLLMQAAHDDNDNVRRSAIIRLADSTTLQAFDLLIAGAADDDDDVASACIEALGRMPEDANGRIRKTLYQIFLSNPDEDTAAALSTHGLAGIALIRQSLTFSEPDVRETAVAYLGNNKLLTTAELDIALRDRNIDVRRAALNTIQDTTPANYRRLERAINDPGLMDIAFDEIIALDFAPVQKLIRFINHPNPRVRIDVIQRLIVFSQYINRMGISDFGDMNPRSRRMIVRDIASTAVLNAITKRLFDHDVEVRRAAADAFSWLPPRSDAHILAVLLRGLEDPDASVREYCARAFRNFHPDQPAIHALLAILQRPVTLTMAPIQVQAALALGNVQEPRALDLLLEMMIVPDPRYVDSRKNELELQYAFPSLSMAAGRALKKLMPSIIPALRRRLNTAVPRLREAVVTALAISSSPDAFNDLLPLLKDPSAKIRALAAWGVGRIGDPRGVEPLRSALHDYSDILVRQRAAEGLGEIGDDRVADDLAAVLPYSYSDLHDQTIIALLRMQSPHTVETLLSQLKTHDQNYGYAGPAIHRVLEALTGYSFENYAEWNHWYTESHTVLLPWVNYTDDPQIHGLLEHDISPEIPDSLAP